MSLVLVAGCGLGWIANRAGVQRRATEAIRRAGGTVLYEGEMKPGTEYHRKTWAPDWLVGRLGIDYFECPVSVVLRSKATDELLSDVGKLSRVKLLFLASSRVTDSGLEYLKGLHELRHLELNGTRITDAGLAHLSGMTRLQSLYLDGDQGITDAGLSHLRSMRRLDILSANETGVTDAGLENLVSLATLKCVYFDYTGVTDDGAQRLKRSVPGLYVTARPKTMR
jgi:hypothetical protein